MPETTQLSNDTFLKFTASAFDGAKASETRAFAAGVKMLKALPEEDVYRIAKEGKIYTDFWGRRYLRKLVKKYDKLNSAAH